MTALMSEVNNIKSLRDLLRAPIFKTTCFTPVSYDYVVFDPFCGHLAVRFGAGALTQYLSHANNRYL